MALSRKIYGFVAVVYRCRGRANGGGRLEDPGSVSEGWTKLKVYRSRICDLAYGLTANSLRQRSEVLRKVRHRTSFIRSDLQLLTEGNAKSKLSSRGEHAADLPLGFEG